MGAVRMATVKNNGPVEYSEEFKGKRITIPAGGEIRMSFSEAHQFKSQFIAPRYNGRGEPVNAKPLSVVADPIGPDAKTDASKEFTCMFDGETFDSQEELNAHIKANYMDKLSKDDAEAFARDGKTPKFVYNGKAYKTKAQMLKAIEKDG